MPAKTLYLAGYARQTIATLEAAVNGLGVTIVDVRLQPSSNDSAFTRYHLQQRFGSRYVWLGEWGNRNYKAEKPWQDIQIADYDAGLARFEAIEGPVLLLCACYDTYKCHRHFLAQRLYVAGYSYRSIKLEEYAPAVDAPTLF